MPAQYPATVTAGYKHLNVKPQCQLEPHFDPFSVSDTSTHFTKLPYPVNRHMYIHQRLYKVTV